MSSGSDSNNRVGSIELAVRVLGPPIVRRSARRRSCGSAHLHPHQASDENRQIELPGDPFGGRRVARLQAQRRDVAETDGR